MTSTSKASVVWVIIRRVCKRGPAFPAQHVGVSRIKRQGIATGSGRNTELSGCNMSCPRGVKDSDILFQYVTSGSYTTLGHK